MTLVIHCDGGSRGNPGPGAAAAIISDHGQTIERSAFLGRVTNNQAEYRAILLGLAYAVQASERQSVEVIVDSQLIARQLQGVYQVKHPELKPLHEQATRLIRQLPAVTIRSVPRAQNALADRLVNQVLDEHA